MAAGSAGLALVGAAADACLPGEGWDEFAHRELAKACADLSVKHSVGSVFAGAAGIGFVANLLARGRDRYANLLAQIDRHVLPVVQQTASRLHAAEGCPVSDFDAISGLAGTGTYLLARADRPDVHVALEQTLVCLTALLTSTGDRPRWHTPPQWIGDVFAPLYPDGLLNCGLAHGVSGPLALLAIAARAGFEVDGQREAIDTAARWLIDIGGPWPWGWDWGSGVSLSATPSPPPVRPYRAAWCYGPAGVARALWLAGIARGNPTYQSVAVQTIRDCLARSKVDRGITSPTFCHGLAGFAQIALRFAKDTQDGELRWEADRLVVELLDWWEPESLLGFRNVEPGGGRVNHPGMLDGAPGVGLVLLAAGSEVAPSWDRLFLLS